MNFYLAEELVIIQSVMQAHLPLILSEITEIWQPMIWQEKRFPDKSYMTLAYRCPLPTTLVTAQDHTFGVVADPSEFPFDPLPLAENSQIRSGGA
jgi:hypothetical protein